MANGASGLVGGLVGLMLGLALAPKKKCPVPTSTTPTTGLPPSSPPSFLPAEALTEQFNGGYLLASYADEAWWYLSGGYRPYPEIAYSASGTPGFYTTRPIAESAWLEAVKFVAPVGRDTDMALYRWDPLTGWFMIYSLPRGTKLLNG